MTTMTLTKAQQKALEYFMAHLKGDARQEACLTVLRQKNTTTSSYQILGGYSAVKKMRAKDDALGMTGIFHNPPKSGELQVEIESQQLSDNPWEIDGFEGGQANPEEILIAREEAEAAWRKSKR
jgi:hypothetical protein